MIRIGPKGLAKKNNDKCLIIESSNQPFDADLTRLSNIFNHIEEINSNGDKYLECTAAHRMRESRSPLSVLRMRFDSVGNGKDA